MRSTSRELRAFLEACHEGPRAQPGEPAVAWAKEVIPRASPLIGKERGIIASFFDKHSLEQVGPWFVTEPAHPNPSWIPPGAKALMRELRGVALLTELTGNKRICHNPYFRAYPHQKKYADIMGVRADSASFGFAITVPLHIGDREPPRAPFHRIQRHLSAAHAARSSALRGHPELRIAEDGGIDTQSNLAPEIGAWAADIARAFEHDLTASIDDQSTQPIWDALHRGNWKVIHEQDTDGKRTLILRQEVDPRAPPEHPRDKRLQYHLSRGSGLKQIANDLGVTVATASYHVQRFLAARGYRDRAEVLRQARIKPIREP
jgi:hypothetical protein